MRRFLRRLLFSVLALVAAFGLFVLVEHVRGRKALAKGIAALQAKGEKLTVDELRPPRPPDDQNGAQAFLAAADDLGPTSRPVLWAAWGWQFVAPGKVWLFVQRDGWSVPPDPFSRPKPANDRNVSDWITMEELAREIDRARPALERMRGALRKPSLDFSAPYSLDRGQARLWDLAARKKVAHWLSVAALNSLRQSDLGASLDSLEALAALAHKPMQERLLISPLVGISIANLGLETTWEALQSAGWTEEQLARLQAAWTGRSYLEEMIPALAMERAIGRALFDGSSTSVLEAQAHVQFIVPTLPKPPPSSSWEQFLGELGYCRDQLHEQAAKVAWRGCYVPLWRAAWADQDHLHWLLGW